MSENIRGIMVLEYPITVNLGEWVIDHPDCDSICERIGTGPNYLIYAYALDISANDALEKFRNEQYPDKKILTGVTMDGIRGLL